MRRFIPERRTRLPGRVFGIVIFSVILLALVYAGTSLLSGRTDTEQAQALQTGLWQSIIHCYCVEGAYPESLDYLKEHYNISYDEDRFFVDYQPMGSNMTPDVTVIVRDPDA